MKEVSGKVAFITGGASGLGLAMAKSFTGAGMKVAIADVQEDALTAAQETFGESNAEVITIKVDVTDRLALEAAADETEAAFGKIHVVCNNAGVAASGNIKDHSYQDWDWLMGVNVGGVINGIQVFTHRILSHGEGGHIVNTASMAGLLPIATLSVYNTSKFAILGVSEAIAQDLAEFNVGVSVLCPGFVNTNIFTSERNRPAAFGGEEASSFDLPEVSSLASDVSSQEVGFDSMIEASMVGDMVLHAIQTNEMYIFSHPEFQEAVTERHQGMLDAFERWSAFRADYE